MQIYHEGHGLAFYTLYPITYDYFNQGVEYCYCAYQLFVSIYIKPQISISNKLNFLEEMMATFVQDIGHLHKIKNTTIFGDFNSPYPNDHDQIELLFIKY